MTGSPYRSFVDDPSGVPRAQVGNHYINISPAGVAVFRHMPNGGVRDIFGGHFQKRELKTKLIAYILGYTDGQSDIINKQLSHK